MRIVMCNWDVASRWGKQEEGRNQSGSFSFSGPNLYSYSTKVGYICKNGRKFVTPKKYSVTTSQQLNRVSRDFTVPFLGETEDDHKGNVRYYLDEIKKTVMEFSNCRSRKGRWIVSQNNAIYEKLKKYCETFELKMPVTLGLYLDPEYGFVKEFLEKRFYKPDEDEWREIFLPKWLADKGMENVEVKDLLRTRNTEVRREIIRIFGIERVCEELGATTIDRQDGYELILLDLKDGRRRPFLKMRNPSVDAWHIEGVHPCLKTMQDALNYRRYGEEMLDIIVPVEMNRADWRKREEFMANPENWQVREEYMTTPLLPNEKDWRPVQLT